MKVTSKAPCRVDFAGSCTDIQPFCDTEPGFIVNAAITRYAYCTYIAAPTDGLTVIDLDTGYNLHISNANELPTGGRLGILRAYLDEFKQLPTGAIILQHDLHPGSGLGSSGATAVSIAATLSKVCGYSLSKGELAEMAYRVERSKLNPFCGRQDPYASAFGGINLFKFEGSRVEREQVSIPATELIEFLSQFAIVSSGVFRSCDVLLSAMFDQYYKKDSRFAEVMHTHCLLAQDLYRAFCAGDLFTVAKLMAESWTTQEQLRLPVSTPETQLLLSLAKQNGAIGSRLGGVGGGGYAAILFDRDKRHQLKTALETHGWYLEQVMVDWNGVEIIEIDD